MVDGGASTDNAYGSEPRQQTMSSCMDMKKHLWHVAASMGLL